MENDFVVGIQLVVQDTKGNDIVLGGQEMLSDETMQMIIENVAEYLNEEGL